MNSLSEPPVQRTHRRLPVPRFSRDPEVRSVQIGVLGTILVHLLLFLTVPYLLQFESGSGVRPTPLAQQFNIELAPDEATAEIPAPEEKPAPFKFVDINPDAPDNVPDDTENFAAQNQQSAQEEETPDMSGNRPAMEGQTEIKTESIVTGRLVPQVPPAPSAPPQQEQNDQVEQTQAPKREQIPLSGFEKSPASAEDSYGSNIAQLPDGSAEVEKQVEGLKDAPMVQNATGMVARIDPKRPQPRPQLEKRARPAIFTENKIGTSNIGSIGRDARWSEYGEYLQRLIESVQIQWERILTQSKVYPTSGTRVVVQFELNSKGQVSRILGVDGTAGELSQSSCVSAITERAPYGDWSEDMVRVLGNEQELTFTFYYQ
jgi:hypothetical protein